MNETLAPKHSVWKTIGGLMPVILVWGVLVAWLAALIANRATWSEETDAAAIREWLDETRVYRKTLPELAREYAALDAQSPRAVKVKEELEEHVWAMAEPTRMYPNQLPLFPEIFRIEVKFAEDDAVQWESYLPRPQRKTDGQVRSLDYSLQTGKNFPRVQCEYHVHAFNKLQQRETDNRQTALLAEALLVASTLLAGLFVYRFLTRERKREVARLSALADARQKEAELLQTRLDRDEAELKQAELARTVADTRSQLYASIGVMAGSYAHNIKNLLVRPNDLLVRCAESEGLKDDHKAMLTEVKNTLGTVTERLQQILRTVHRDPNATDAVQSVNLSRLVMETLTTWAPLARDKWKVLITAEVAVPNIAVTGDESHLQQALENLIFNARDATFEMRNVIRDEARSGIDVSAETRKAKLMAAAAWKGEIKLLLTQTPTATVLAVTDNGIGMTDEVKARCLETHFSTKRDNALYQGHAAGMGLGLSFVAMVLQHHQATLEIESTTRQGTTFRVNFPRTPGLETLPTNAKTRND